VKGFDCLFLPWSPSMGPWMSGLWAQALLKIFNLWKFYSLRILKKELSIFSEICYLKSCRMSAVYLVSCTQSFGLQMTLDLWFKRRYVLSSDLKKECLNLRQHFHATHLAKSLRSSRPSLFLSKIFIWNTEKNTCNRNSFYKLLKHISFLS
jgi:hypothetical protein